MNESIEFRRLEIVVLAIIADGRARCGSGFGKYPLGILSAVERLLPLMQDSERVALAVQDFKIRLDR